MMKLDAKIVSYLAGDNVSSSDEQLALQCLKTSSSPLEQLVGKIAKDRVDTTFHDVESLEAHETVAARPLSVGQHIDGITLHIEALTLQPEGTKRMELLQNEMRPIFTVECQLSNDLIAHVERYDMFHVMQFESEKFHSLTQCTRFGQESYRDIKLEVAPTGEQQSGGQLSFTVWWREPGTCLNEMLGMGRVSLRDMCNASLLEQCKCISIYKRQTHLASLYMKISLKSQAAVPRRLLDAAAVDGDNNNRSNGAKQQQPTSDNKLSASSSLGGGAMSAGSDDHVQTNNNNNNNLHVQSGDFTNETSKVRLLKGFICASELRNVDLNGSNGRDYELVLVCRRFWQEEVAAITTQEDGNNFNYQEQFAVINDEKFLKRADKQYLTLEFWQRRKETAEPTSSDAPAIVPLGIARLPMHQFFIAYRDAAITNHLCNGKLPVVSFDGWAPITRSAAAEASSSGRPTPTMAGEIKCLLAIGSEEQISHLRSTKGLPANTSQPSKTLDSKALHDLLNSRKSLGYASPEADDHRAGPRQSTADLMDLLQRKLATTHAPAVDSKSFQFILNVRQAKDLPLNASTGSAKGSKKAAKRNTNAMRRFPPNEPPSSYVTFQAAACHASSYKSHEGDVYATHIVPKSTQPRWAQSFRVTASREYLSNARKRFIVKIWKKSNHPTTATTCSTAATTTSPTPLDDAIIGFAAIDLTPLARGYNVSDWYNVVDFNGRINGQLEVECCALHDADQRAGTAPVGPMHAATGAESSIDTALAAFESSLQLSSLNLGQAIKRKIDELEEISQRLRSRLGDVTGEALPAAGAGEAFDMSALDNWKSLETVLDGEEFLAHDDFERDIATPTPTEMGASGEHHEAETKQS